MGLWLAHPGGQMEEWWVALDSTFPLTSASGGQGSQIASLIGSSGGAALAL